jgi:hypothetical protein
MDALRWGFSVAMHVTARSPRSHVSAPTMPRISAAIAQPLVVRGGCG